jgi:hypothetical protein
MRNSTSPFFTGWLGCDRDVGDPALDQGHDRGGDIIVASHLGVGVVVVHQHDECADDDDATQYGGRHGPLVERDT